MIRMNTTEMHQTFPQKELRDFLSLAMVKALDDEAKNQKKHLLYSEYEDPFEWAKDDAREHIKHYKQYIRNIETKQAILRLIELNGWKEHDVSDDLYNDTEYHNWMSFLGTEDELEELHHIIYEHDKIDK